MNVNPTVRWLWRRFDCTVSFYFTVWLWWIDKPVWKWIFLVLLLLEVFSIAHHELKEEKGE